MTKLSGLTFAAVALGLVLAVQGWRARPLNGDVIPYIDAAHELVQHGTLPYRGNPNSYAAYAPPGMAWFITPGVVMFRDMRLYELPGGLALYLGTLAGVFLLGRASFGTRGAVIAVILCALSSHELFLAGSLWPLGHPGFFVWMSYGVHLWATRRRVRYLVAAMVVWSAGMYVHMGLAPAVLMIPAVWWVYRPPLSWRATALAGVAAALIWFPYLRFEAGRGFMDLRAQLLRQALQPVEKYGWCDPTLRVAEWTPREVPPGMAVVDFTERMSRSVMANFPGVVPASGVLLLVATMAGLVLLTRRQPGPQPTRRGRNEASNVARINVWSAVAGGLLLVAAVLNEWIVARYLSVDGVLTPQTTWSIRAWQAGLVFASIALFGRRSIRRRVVSLGFGFEPLPGDRRPLLLALGVPWVVLLLVAEPGLEHRFVFLWPVQVMVLAATYASITAVSSRALWCRRAGGLALASLVVFNPIVVERVTSWSQGSWPGIDSPRLQAADYLAGVLRSEGRTEAAIGYRLFDSALPDAAYPGADRRSKVGGVFDAMLEYQTGITNTDRCAEGVSERDEYRVLQIAPPSEQEVVFVEAPAAGRVLVLQQFGDLQVVKLVE